MEAYCVKCKTKREMADPEPVFTATGSPATKGRCPVCGTNLFRMGETEAHAGMPRPERTAPKRKASKGKAGKAGGNGARKGKLVIVESPAKAKTIGRFLGKGYTVRASVGHVRDLLRSTLSVDVENEFIPKYRVPNEKREVVKALKADAAHAEQIFLATDPDREGEAIAWHLLEAAEIEPERTKRVVFHEITKPAIEEAFAHPRDISMDLVNAQQTRRILDRLVGYSLSPLLWAKVRGRLSAGRVQSVAVRLIVDRERAIDAFTPSEYWSVDADLVKASGHNGSGEYPSFRARLVRIGEDEVGTGENSRLKTETDVQAILPDLERAKYMVVKVKIGERRRNPAAPFTTSTLQQEASRRLGFTAKRTMATAQQLYEGVEIGDDQATGLITYMRTDSANVSAAAQHEARQWVTERFGADFLPEEPPQYKTRSKGAQEAHEAIRPTQVDREPKAISEYLTKDQLRLYTLIWQRFVASQMAPAVFDTLSVEIEARGDGTYLFRVTGSVLKFQGFMALYEEARDEDSVGDEEAEQRSLPPLTEAEALNLLRLLPEQHFTQPPPRFTEASLVKALEEYGIGRPSTYAPTISTIQQRGYVIKEEKRLAPTETGIIVNDLLVDHFPEIVDLNFTANMENELDQIADGEREWVGVLSEFWAPFAEQVKVAEAEMPQVNTGPEYVGRDCPETGHPLIIRWGRYGKFIGCSDFPKCRYTEPWLEKIGVACPKDQGEIVERKTRKGRVFFGCANYPECDFTSWKRPLPQPCPDCGGLLVVANKTTAQCTVCEHTFLLDSLPTVENQAVEEIREM
jgi:DNA topoisomerase-1